MATIEREVAGVFVVPAGPEPVVAPRPQDNEFDAEGQRSRQLIARQIVEDHKAALAARFNDDLLREMLTLHVDGTGDFQWASIYEGTRVEIPRFVSEYRKTENILRLIVANAVAHHTTMPIRYFAESTPDRRAREKALIDTIWINYLAEVQDFNSLFADALYLAMSTGFCPVHAYWRDDATHDWFEPITSGATESRDPFSLAPGMIDCWVGNPFDTVFDRSAKRGSIGWCSYARVLPADLVRRAFDHIPGVANLEGTTKVPSAAELQRIARNWQTTGLGVHGTSVMQERRDNEELLTLVCRETAPGWLGRDDPGRLQIVAVPGTVDLRKGEGNAGHALLLVDQPLPGGTFSFENFYSDHRGSDVHGKPWIEPLDQIQVDLNIALSKHWEAINKMLDAPIVAPGGALDDDLVDLGGYNLLEVEPSLAGWRPRVMEWPYAVVQSLERMIEQKRRALYTGGGYQAVSRGEAPGSRMAYRAILALQQADSTIHAPVNKRFQRSACNFAGICWRQMKAFGDVPWLVSITGDEYAHLVEPYIDNTKLSEAPPRYKMVNAFGASPEMRAQEILDLLPLRGADGEPFIKTSEARRSYPNQFVFDEEADPRAVQKRHARTIVAAAESIARRYREETGFFEDDPSHPWVQQAAQHVFYALEQRFPRLRDDDLQAHINAYSELTQDDTADPIARQAITMRQNLYYEWQAQMAMAGVPQPGQEQAPPGSGNPAGQGGMSPREVAGEMFGGGGPQAVLGATGAA